MSEVEKRKQNIILSIQGLCAHCVNAPLQEHSCPVAKAVEVLEGIQGVPLIVNQEFRGILQVV